MRNTSAAVLAVCTLALIGCSSSAGAPSKPSPAVTVTKAPALSAAEQQAACVGAWADAIDKEAGADQTPTACASVPDSAQLDAYMEGLHERNKRAQASFQACIDDPSTCPTEP